MESLPIEILSIIFSYLNPTDRAIAKQVCKRWNQAFYYRRPKMKGIINSFVALDVIKHLSYPLSCIVLKDIDISESMVESFHIILEHVTTVEFNNCNILEKTFCNLICSCKNLEVLILKKCHSIFITGTLFDNATDGALSEAFKNVNQLVIEDAAYFSDFLFDRLMRVMPTLKSLALTNCTMTFHNAIYKRFYPNLTSPISSESLSLSVLTFQTILSRLSNISNSLQDINFTNTFIDNKSLLNLATLPGLKLRGVSLSSCSQITGAGFKRITPYQTFIQSLDLSNSRQIDDNALCAIGSYLKNLKKLNISACESVTDKGVIALSHLSCLEHIDISCCKKISSDGFEETFCKGNLKEIQHLNLSYTYVDDNSLENILKSFKKLIYLDLTYCSKITNKGALSIYKYSKMLRHLRLAYCANITSEGIAGISQFPEEMAPTISDLRGLHHLDLCACSKIGPNQLCKTLHFLELNYLNLSLCKELTDLDLVSIGNFNTSLESLILAQCVKITNEGLRAALCHLPRLKHLNLQGCRKLGNPILKDIQKYCPMIKYLDILHCANITPEAVNEFDSSLRFILINYKHSKIDEVCI